MCGLFGIAKIGSSTLGQEEINRARLARDCLKHRGPDQFGEWIGDNLFIGHRRLSILDTSPNGRQPMQTNDGNIVLSANGEIYNFKLLRRAIGEAEFASTSDSEVLLHGYRKWGIEGLLDRIDGMYAFTIYDRQNKELILVRDRVGIKPLYFGRVGTYVVWGSELKAIEAYCEPNDLTIDETAAYDFITYRYIPAPKTLYKEVCKLEPGTYARISCETGRVQISRYWALEVHDRQVDEEIAAQEVLELLRGSVCDQLISDVPIGFFLSGGIDSSAIVGLASQERNGISTYTIGFDSAAKDESQFAEIIAQKFSTRHTVKVLTEATIEEDLCDWMCKVYDEPFADTSALATYRVAELASNEVKVVLSGDGGDEVFGGYRWYRRYVLWRRMQFGLSGIWPKGARLNFHRPPGNVRQKIGNRVAIWAQMDPLELYHSLMPGLLAFEREPYRRQWQIPKDYDDMWHFRRYYRPDLGAWKSLQFLDFNTFLPDDILTKVDRVTMAVSLEARVPFLAHKVVEYAFSLPESFLYSGGELKGGLKKAMRTLLPDSIIDRDKRGFSIPTSNWRRSVLGDFGTFQETYTRKMLSHFADG